MKYLLFASLSIIAIATSATPSLALTGRIDQEFQEGLGNKLTGRIEQEFKEGLGNKLTGRIEQEFKEGLGNK